MKRYERKASQATKKERGVGASRDPAWIGAPILHSRAAKAGWLARYKAEAVKLEAKRRPSRKDQERLQKLHDAIERLIPRRPRRAVRKAPAAKQRVISHNQPVRRKSAKKASSKKRAAKAPVRKRLTAKASVRKRPARKVPVVKRPARKVPVVKRPSRKVPVVRRPAHKTPAGKQIPPTLTPEDVARMTLGELSRFELAASKRRRELQEAQRILIAEEYTQDPEQMKAHLLDLRDEAIARGEVEIPRERFNETLPANTRVHRGQKIYVLARAFLNDPGVILEVMVKAAHAANKLIPIPKATWLANISILVYGQKTFGSPPTAWAGKSPDAALFQVQSYASTGAQPTKIGMLDALQDILDTAAETTKSVVWLEYLTIQQFTPLDTEEKKAWRREQARKKREQRARRKKKVTKKPRLRKKKSLVQPKKKRALSGRKSSSVPKKRSKPKTVIAKPKKASSRPSIPKVISRLAGQVKARSEAKKVKAKVKKKSAKTRKSNTSSRSKVR